MRGAADRRERGYAMLAAVGAVACFGYLALAAIGDGRSALDVHLFQAKAHVDHGCAPHQFAKHDGGLVENRRQAEPRALLAQCEHQRPTQPLP